MKLIDRGIAGTLESSDIMVTLEENPSGGITINLKSTVENQFGEQIRKVITDTLKEIGLSDVCVNANDRGALDCTVRARVLAAAYRACRSTYYKWGI